MREEKRFTKGFVCGIAAAAAFAAAAFGASRITAYVIGQDQESAVQAEAEAGDVPQNLQLDIDAIGEKIDEIEGVVNDYYLNDVDSEEVEADIYKGLVEGLDDPYAAYYTEEELVKQMESTSGAYEGIGASLTQEADTGTIIVVSCYEDAPADRAGLQPGDIIYTVNGTEVTGMDLTDVVTRIKTDEGDTVHIQVVREGEDDYLDFDLEREEVSVPTVSYSMLEDNIGYLAVSEFDTVTVDQFSAALDALTEEGMEKLIIDLRNNLGGVLQACCDMLRLLLPEGLIVYTEDKDGVREEYRCDGANEFTKPLVVLVNGYSASAAEIFCGAIKDYGIGTLVGTTTYGKGIVQRIVNLGDGTAVKLTVSKYYTPNGTDIHEKGIEPDVTVELDESLRNQSTISFEEDNQLQTAIEILKEEE